MNDEIGNVSRIGPMGKWPLPPSDIELRRDVVCACIAARVYFGSKTVDEYVAMIKEQS
jgi:hypothetical protein